MEENSYEEAGAIIAQHSVEDAALKALQKKFPNVTLKWKLGKDEVTDIESVTEVDRSVFAFDYFKNANGKWVQLLL